MNWLLVFVLLVSSPKEERQAKILIDCIHKYGGAYANCPIYVFIADTLDTPGDILRSQGVNLISLKVDKNLPGFPFSLKVQAMAQAEKMLEGITKTLAWLDCDVLIINEPDELFLKDDMKAAIRPVFLKNNIGLSPESSVDKFWEPILKYAGLKVDDIPVVNTFVDEQKVRGYYNCGIFSIDPKLHILEESSKLFKILIKDNNYLKNGCNDGIHQIFLHQAVFSALVTARIKQNQIHWFSDKCVYPLDYNARIKSGKVAEKLSDLSCIKYENLWGTPDWVLNILPMEEKMNKWLKEEYKIIYKVTDNIYREEGLCNTYLIKTKRGYVLIDPGGASDSANSILYAMNIKPDAILLTHAHTDHTKGIELWKGDREIPVIAQKEYRDFVTYNFELNKFYGERNKAQGNVITTTELKIEPNTFFNERYTYKKDDLHFVLIHTPGETPDQATIWIPELRAAFVADNYNITFPNISPLRGGQPRWAKKYINALDTILKLKPIMVFPGHGEPVIGEEKVQRKLTKNRDAIKYVYDEVIKGMNDGKDVYSLMNEIKLPENLNIDQSYGKVSWAVRGIYEGYAGWYDGNPKNMYSLPVSSVYGDLVNLTGGTGNIIKRAEELLAKGEDAKVLHLCDIIIKTEPGNKKAHELKSSAMKSLLFKSDNYIESRFLRYYIKTGNEIIKSLK